MPSLFLHADIPTSGFHSPAFVGDVNGITCQHFGVPIPATYQVQNLDGFFYNMADINQDQLCQTLRANPQFTTDPGAPITRTNVANGESFAIQANDVQGPRTLHCRIDWVAGSTAVDCPYGTQLKAGEEPMRFIDDALLNAIFSPFAAAELVAFYIGFRGTQFVLSDLCSRLPPKPPIYTGGELLRSVTFMKQLLDAAAWPLFCECKPGTPTPKPPDRPVLVIPDDIPSRPIITCSETDLCQSIIALLDQVGQLQTVVGQLWALAYSSQRYGTPFASIPGRTHAGLTGSGTALIDRLVAVQCVVRSKPGGLQTFLGAPEYVTDLGWISAITGDGMLDEIRLTRDVQLWGSKLLPFATQIGWALRDGVTIDLVEQLAEP